MKNEENQTQNKEYINPTAWRYLKWLASLKIFLNPEFIGYIYNLNVMGFQKFVVLNGKLCQ